MSEVFERWTGLALQSPDFLLLLPLLVVALLVRRARGHAAVAFAPQPFTRDLPPTLRTRLAASPVVLEALGLVLVVVALARPVHREALPLENEGIDVVLCLDVSSSMLANDMDRTRTRLDVSKAAAARFAASRPHDRIGLVRFARFPDVVCPPTLDHRALAAILGGVRPVPHDGPEDMTGIGTAVARAAQLLRASTAKSRVVVLLTDGEENVATAQAPTEIGPAKAARLCVEFGVRVYAIAAGIGHRLPDGRWQPLDTQPLEALARDTQGRFFEARDATAMDAVYASIDTLEKVEFEEPRYVLEERFLPVLVAGLVLLLVGRFLAATVLETAP